MYSTCALLTSGRLLIVHTSYDRFWLAMIEMADRVHVVNLLSGCYGKQQSRVRYPRDSRPKLATVYYHESSVLRRGSGRFVSSHHTYSF